MARGLNHALQLAMAVAAGSARLLALNSDDLDTGERGLRCVEQTYLKQYCSLIHGQVVIDAVLAPRAEHHLRGADVDRVSLEVFQGAYEAPLLTAPRRPLAPFVDRTG